MPGETEPSNGSGAIALALKRIGVKHIFGLVGIPVIEVASACMAAGIDFISFRNEQSATYAASVYGFLTGRPGVALVVGGPGVVHALAGVENANANRFPLLLLAGSSETFQRGMGAFQQLDQVALMRGFAKFAEQPADLSALPALVEKAYRTSYYGVPGTTYIDLPANLIQAGQCGAPVANALAATTLPPPGPRTMADPAKIRAAAQALKGARTPLLIVGKGCAYARAEGPIRALQMATNLAFLPTPMGKGVIPDGNPLNVSAARTAALKNSDVILVLGGRLNWILHYGMEPKFHPGVKIIQVDISAEDLGDNAGDALYGIWGDVGFVAEQLVEELRGWKAPPVAAPIRDSKVRNEAKAEKSESNTQVPLLYQPVYRIIRDTLEDLGASDVIYVSEGANTMDISRSSFPLSEPRRRLDAGTNATMGVGMGYAVAAKVASPKSLVVAIEGDSAFGFSGFDVDTAVRHDLPMVIYIMNNSGLYHGVDPDLYQKFNAASLPPTALGLDTRYDLFAKSLGADGYLASTLDEVREATKAAVRSNRVSLINVLIDPGKDKKLEFGWMASGKAKI